MVSIDDTLSPRERAFWLQRRQALLIELASIEEFLGLRRSVPPKHQRGSGGGAEEPCRDRVSTAYQEPEAG